MHVYMPVSDAHAWHPLERVLGLPVISAHVERVHLSTTDLVLINAGWVNVSPHAG